MRTPALPDGDCGDQRRQRPSGHAQPRTGQDTASWRARRPCAAGAATPGTVPAFGSSPAPPPGTASSASSAGRRLRGQRARAGPAGMTMGLSTQEGRGASGAGPGAGQHAGRSRQGPHWSRDPGVGTQAAEAPSRGQHQAGRPCRPEPLLLQAWEPSAQAGEAGEGQLGLQRAH